jgi:hypothetical protein
MGEVLFAHVYGLMNALPAPLPAALVRLARKKSLQLFRVRQLLAGQPATIELLEQEGNAATDFKISHRFCCRPTRSQPELHQAPDCLRPRWLVPLRVAPGVDGLQKRPLPPHADLLAGACLGPASGFLGSRRHRDLPLGRAPRSRFLLGLLPAGIPHFALVEAHGSGIMDQGNGRIEEGREQMSRLVRVLDDKDVIELLHSSVKKAGGQVAFAHETGVDRAHLNMVLNGKRPPTWSIIDALNLGVVYVALDQSAGLALGKLRRWTPKPTL